MVIKIETLRCFATVAQTGSLVDAAMHLGRTPSAISMALKQFEETLGQKLFESDRKNKLTPFGRQVLELALEELKQFDNTVSAIKELASSPHGLLRVASIPSVASIFLPQAISRMRTRFPKLRFDLQDTDTIGVIDNLVRGQADVGIASGTHQLNGIQSIPLFDDDFGLICAPQHPLADHGSGLCLKNVVTEDFIFNSLCRTIKTQTFHDIMNEPMLSVHNTLSLIAMVRSGNWVTILPNSVMRNLCPDLVFRPIRDLTEKRQVSFLKRENTPFPDFADALEDILRDFDWAGATPSVR